MSRRAILAAVLLLAACQRFESPTAPESGRVIQAEATGIHGVTVLPDTTVVAAGRKTTAGASLNFPLALPVTFSSSNPAVAIVTGKIEAGATSAELQITGVAPGQVKINYTIMNFAGPPGVGSAGTVEVTAAGPEVPPPCVVPAVTIGAASTTIRSGESASLSARAEGTAPMTYQWFEDGTAITGATSRVYVTRPLNAPATYTVKATSPCGSRTSDPLTISVATPARRRAAGR
jgi:hypothetical protein